MELHQEYAQRAFTSFKTADHLTYITFPLIKDNKLILTILENLNTALTKGMDAILEYERFYKRIKPLPNNFDVRFNTFRNNMIRYNVKESEVRLIMEIKRLIDSHKASPVEFSRKDKFIICTNDYKVQTISIKEIKDYLVKTKSFLMKVDSIITKNG